MSVAKEILSQLGGNKFIAMTGAKAFVGSNSMLMFCLPSNFAAKKINKVRITLTSADLYNVEFFYIRGTNVKKISEAEGVYADQLKSVFESHTALLVSMGTLGNV